MMPPLIELESVSFGYRAGHAVLSDVTVRLLPGERIGLLGANGSGKTTLLHLVVGLLKPTSGTIRAFGLPRREEADFLEVRQRAGLVFQDSDDQLFSPTVLEDVAFGPLNLGKSPDAARRIASETLRLVGMAGFEERVTYQLSGGEKRLIALATVLAMHPDVLLLDEPTNGLDETSCARVLGVLMALPQAMMIVSHEREFVNRLATRTVSIERGTVSDGHR